MRDDEVDAVLARIPALSPLERAESGAEEIEAMLEWMSERHRSLLAAAVLKLEELRDLFRAVSPDAAESQVEALEVEFLASLAEERPLVDLHLAVMTCQAIGPMTDHITSVDAKRMVAPLTEKEEGELREFRCLLGQFQTEMSDRLRAFERALDERDSYD